MGCVTAGQRDKAAAEQHAAVAVALALALLVCTCMWDCQLRHHSSGRHRQWGWTGSGFCLDGAGS